MKRLLTTTMFAVALMGSYLWAQVPAPDAFYTFDEADGTLMADSSGNTHSAYWYNYFGEDPGSPETSTAGWRPTEGYRNGAAYLSGDHAVCPEDCPDPGSNCSCSSGTDLLMFSEDQNPTGACDDNLVSPSTNTLFRGSSDSFTVAFWFKNDWNYLCADPSQRRLCYTSDNDCAFERQVLYTAGNGDEGITMAIEPGATFPALLRVWIKGGAATTVTTMVDTASSIWDREWLHIAVTFAGDGNSAGTAKLYLDGVERRMGATDFGTVTIGGSSTVFGGESGTSVSGFNVTACWGNVDNLACGITAQYYSTIRYGWPARGWLDELAYWKGKTLTTEQIETFADIGNRTTPTSLSDKQTETFDLFPSPSLGSIHLRGLREGQTYEALLVNAMGQVLKRYPDVSEGNSFVLPPSLNNGIYYLQLRQDGRPVGVDKFLLNR
jgi:hypothetical protein